MNRKKKGGLSFYQKEKKISNEKLKEIGSWIFLGFVAVLLAYVLTYSIGIKTSVIGSSMEPELSNGQEVLINRIVYNFLKPNRGDVIVFRPNGNENAHFYVKRVVGVPGDTIQISEGILYLNGKPQEDMFSDKIEDSGVAKEEITLGDEEFFVMGDNCNNSEDSRSANVGNVNKSTIIGKAWFHMASATDGLGTVH